MTTPSITLTPPRGRADAPLLVLGPSLGTSTILWEDVVPALTPRYRVALWDLPGHGASPAANEPFTVAELADAVAQSIGEPFAYAGVSLGGAVGIELALRHPGALARVAIVASGAKLGDADAWNARAAQVRAQSTSSLISGSAERWFAPGSIERRPDLSGRLLHALQAADDESYARCCEALAVFDARESLPRIDTPLLALWGEHDGVAPEALSDELATRTRNGSSRRIADAAHLPPAEQPDATAQALLEFLEAR